MFLRTGLLLWLAASVFVPPLTVADLHLSSAAQELNIHNERDLMLYFEAHRVRTRRLALYAFDNYWREVAKEFGVEGMANLDAMSRLRKEVDIFLRRHDLAKMDTKTAHGLLEIFGTKVDGNVSLQEQKNYLDFIGNFNGRDEAIGEKFFVARKTPPKLQRFCEFFEKLGDIVDRGMSPEAAIEMGKSMIRASKSSDKFLDHAVFKKIPKEEKEHCKTIFRRIAASIEARYDTLTFGMQYRELRTHIGPTEKTIGCTSKLLFLIKHSAALMAP